MVTQKKNKEISKKLLMGDSFPIKLRGARFHKVIIWINNENLFRIMVMDKMQAKREFKVEEEFR
jgi:hypothetical protein